jgi:fermentation-respiration switch protein FrsA (DUF1100 family)
MSLSVQKEHSRFRRWPRGCALAALAIVLLYSVASIAGCALQESFIFPQSVEEPVDRPPPRGADLVWVETEDHDRVEGWYFPGADRSAQQPGPAVIFFHGNNEVLDHCLEYVDLYQPMGVSVLLVEYRGYGRSGGSPSQDGIGRDMDRFYAWLTARQEVDASRLIYHGRSLGGGVAADLASRHPPAAIILMSSFTSMRAMFRRYFVPGFLCRHPFEVVDVLREFTGPVLVMHGKHDNIVPVSHGRKLARETPNAIYVELDANHDLPPDWREHAETIRAFLDQNGFLE